MKVRFLKSCGTVSASYAKGGTYDLPTPKAKQFIKEGLAVSAEPQKRTRTKKAEK